MMFGSTLAPDMTLALLNESHPRGLLKEERLGMLAFKPSQGRSTLGMGHGGGTEQRRPQSGLEGPLSFDTTVAILNQSHPRGLLKEERLGVHALNRSLSGSSHRRIPVRPATSQGFVQGPLGTLKPKGGGVGLEAGMARRNVKSLPGWKQFFDHSKMSYYWVNTTDHTAQWHHPSETRKPRKESDEGLKKAEVKLRADKIGIPTGYADHWLTEYRDSDTSSKQTTALKTRQTVLAMLHRWASKWGKIYEAFRGMDVKANGEVSRSQLRTALIRFNVSYRDDLLDTVWAFLDPSDTGSVKISMLTDFVLKSDPMKERKVGFQPLDNDGGGDDTAAGAKSQEQIQLRNAAAEKNAFARSLLLNITRLQHGLSQVGRAQTHIMSARDTSGT